MGLICSLRGFAAARFPGFVGTGRLSFKITPSRLFFCLWLLRKRNYHSLFDPHNATTGSKSASIFLIIKYIKHLQLRKDTYQIPLPFAMTIIPSNMIGHFLVHSSILPSRSSPSALVAEVERPLAVQLRSSCEKL